MKDTLLKQAYSYLEKGYSIIPLKPKSKEPYTMFLPDFSWKDYQTRYPSGEELEKWFTNGQANIGIVTGKISGITVVDIDPKNGGDLSQFESIETKKIKTGSGGLHLYFRYSQDVLNSNGFVRGVDIKNDGGYVVAPPSTHPNGTQYAEILSTETAVFPNWIRLLRDEKKTIATKYEGVSEGNRNTAETQIVGELIHYMPQEKWEEIAWPYIQIWNEHCEPPQSPIDLRRTFESICSRELSKLVSSSNESGLVFPDLLTVADLLELAPEDVNWIWEEFIAKGEITLFSALPKTGKSTLLEHLLGSMQREEPFLGFSTKKCNTLVISEESGSLVKKHMMRQKLDDGIFFFTPPVIRQTQKSWPRFTDYILESCRKLNIELVVIDTLSALWPVENENEAPQVEKAVSELKKIVKEDIAMLIVHHTRKSGGENGTAHRGSGALAAATSINIEYERPSGDPFTTQRKLKTMGRYETPPELTIDYVFGKFQVLGTTKQVVHDLKHKKILDILPEAPEGVTTEKIREDWRLENGEMSQSTLSRVLNELRDAGKAEIVESKGRVQKWGKKRSIKEQLEEIKEQQTQETGILMNMENFVNSPVRLG